MTEQLLLTADLTSGRQLRQTLLAVFGALRINAEAADDFVLAVNEAFSNAVYHGTSSSGDLIEVQIFTSADACHVVLDYPGEPFSIELPCLPADLAARGRGRYLMERLSDRVDYEFRQGRTRARLLKRWS